MAQSKTLLKSLGLRFIPTRSMGRNKQNPRMIFEEESMTALRDSIKKVGILVPLSVYKLKGQDAYVILDGERRWRCANQLGQEMVPANIVAEPDLITNILTMFNIHNVRESWEITPTALKVESVMKLTNTRKDKELSELTGLSVARIHDCKKLLEFDRKYLDMTIIGHKEERLSGDFFIQLYPVLRYIRKEFPEVYNKYGNDGIVDIMINKYRHGSIGAVLDFRYLLRTINSMKKGVTKDVIKKAITEVLEKKDFTLKAAYESVAKNIYDMEKIQRATKNLVTTIKKLNTSHLKPDSKMISALTDLRNEIDSLIQRLSA